MSENDERNEGPEKVRPLRRARRAASGTLERGRAAAREGLAGARERFKDATETARERSAEWRDTARERYEDTVVQLRDGYGQLRENVEGATDDLGDYVRANPGKAVLIAAAIGFVLGLALRPRD